MEYLMYIDESCITAARFCSLSAFSLPRSSNEDLKAKIRTVLVESNIEEFKWKKLKDAKYFFAAKKLLDLIFKSLENHKIRIDTLVWDTHDRRHRIVRRNDLANYERMVYHLLCSAMKMREKGATWHIGVDERNGIDWQTVNKCLSASGSHQVTQDTLFGTILSDPLFRIANFKPVNSHQVIPIQVADLFSGMASFSSHKGDAYLSWRENKDLSLFSDSEPKCNITNREEQRFKLLEYFDDRCKNLHLGVSIKTNRRLQTFNQSNPINFWNYEPQGAYDSAPTKAKYNCIHNNTL